MAVTRKIGMDRRDLLIGLAAGTVIPILPGCADNPALGRSQIALISDEQIMRLSDEAWRSALARERVLLDPAYQRRVERVGRTIVDTTGLTHLPWEFIVVDNDTVNAWVLPNGKVAFHKGLLDLAIEDSHIATVMGHEAGHVAGRHANERASQQQAARIGLQIVGVALQGADIPYDRDMAAALGAGVTYGVILPYSRRHEYEADRLGIDYMARAGYPVSDAMDFWLAMSVMHAGRTGEFMSTHPSDDSRIAAMRAHIQARGYV